MKAMLAAGGAILLAAPEAGRRLVAGGTLLPAFHDDFVALSVYSKRAVGWKARVFSGDDVGETAGYVPVCGGLLIDRQSRVAESRSTELGDSSTTRLTTATADDDTAEDTAYTQDDVI